MNNKPVAWMSQGGDVSRSKRYFEELGFTDLIPLHPVKELTDEKIMSVRTHPMTDIEFARALLREAQET